MEKQPIKYSSAFNRLAGVYVFHDYYKNKICKDLEIRPEIETLFKMKQHGILFRSEPNGFSLAKDGNKSLEAHVFQGILELNFDFKITNPFFLNYTDIPFETDQYFYFKNSDSEEKQSLHADAYVGKQDLADIDGDGLKGRITLSFQIDGGLTQDSKEYTIYFAARKSIWKYIISGTAENMKDYNSYFVKSANRIGMNHHFNIVDEKPEIRSFFEIMSSGHLPFEEKPGYVFELRRDKTNGLNVPYKRVLPNANPRNLLFDYKRNQFLTEIFVKL
jgi:hypothetical protein